MPTISATAARSTPSVDLSIPRTDGPHRRRHHESDDVERSDSAAPRRNPLVAAMMQALGSLMPSSKTTAATDTTAAATPAKATDSSTAPATTSTDATSSLKDAAMAFAHELFNALRSAGSGRDGGDSTSEGGRVHGHHHHHHGHGYGDMAQRLERLADQVAAPAKATQAAQPDAAAVSITASLTTASINTTSNSADGSNTTSVNLTTVNLSLTQQPAAADTAKQESPLLSAFRKLFDALQPASASDAAKPDAASGLASFLRQLAQSLRNGQDAAAPAVPTQGSLISVAA
jgi:hypothetical protein